MKIKGTHNSMSFLPVKKWWMKPLNLIARCQGENVFNICEKQDSCFDIRIRFDDNNVPYFCHGLVEYKGDVFRFLRMISECSYEYHKKIYIRLILETSSKDLFQELTFTRFYNKLLIPYSNLTFFEFRRKYDWKQLIPDNNNIEVIQYVNSIRCKWMFIPWLYAKLYKKKHQKEFADCEAPEDKISIHLFDFI